MMVKNRAEIYRLKWFSTGIQKIFFFVCSFHTPHKNREKKKEKKKFKEKNV